MICNTKRKGFFQYRIQSRRAPPQGFNSWCSIWKFWTNITWSNRGYFQELGNMSCSWLTAFTTGAKQKNRMTLKNNLEKNKYSIQFPWKCGGKQKKNYLQITYQITSLHISTIWSGSLPPRSATFGRTRTTFMSLSNIWLPTLINSSSGTGRKSVW